MRVGCAVIEHSRRALLIRLVAEDATFVDDDEQGSLLERTQRLLL